MDPSDLSLLGLVRHMVNVERGWFGAFAGQLSFRHTAAGETDDPTAAWTDSGVADADPAADLTAYQETCRRSRELVAGADLDDTHTNERGRSFSLRWLFLHMIQEYARHNGHADLLRERIDGATGV